MVGLDKDRDPSGLVDLQDLVHRRPGLIRRIGMGLQALYNGPLMERLPASFTALLARLDRVDVKSDGEGADAGRKPDDTRAGNPPPDRHD